MQQPAEGLIPEKSIAVLPFENLSDEKQYAFLADGFQDEILTNLAKVADLKVISRTSVMQYKGGVQRNLRERMDSCVRAACNRDRVERPERRSERLTNDSLHSALSRLRRPPTEPRAVVLQR